MVSRCLPNGSSAQGTASDAELAGLMRARPGDDPERREACEELVRRHQAIVRASVQRYRESPEPVEDLMQVAYVGLLKAINNFDPEIGQSLAAYALPCVTGELKRHFRDKRWQIRVHRAAQELRLRIREAVAPLTQQLARRPTDADLAVYLQVSEAEIADAQLASQAFQVAYLDAPIAVDDGTRGQLGELIGAEDPRLEHTVDMESVWKHLADLPVREQNLLMMRFFGNMTQQEIGTELGISQMHVSRLLRHALEYLREQLTAPS
jgi:RNA polymerase sigma-B factor